MRLHSESRKPKGKEYIKNLFSVHLRKFFIVGFLSLSAILFILETRIVEVIFLEADEDSSQIANNVLEHEHPIAPWKPPNPGIYNWSSLPQELAEPLKLLFPPEQTWTKPPIVASVRSLAGGASDRITSLRSLGCMALIAGRPLAVEPDFFIGGSEYFTSQNLVDTPFGRGPYFVLRNKSSADKDWQLVAEASRNFPHQPIAVNTFFGPGDWCIRASKGLDLPGSFPQISSAQAFAISSYLSIFNSTYDGALLLHAAWGNQNCSTEKIRRLEDVAQLQKAWSEFVTRSIDPKYTMVHMRVSGGNINVSTNERKIVQLKGLPYFDSKMASKQSPASSWLREMKDLSLAKSEKVCSVPLVISSDSSRFVGEATHLLYPLVNVASCCSTPVHIARMQGTLKEKGMAIAEEQVFFDFITMAKAYMLVNTMGGFGPTGRRFLSYKNKRERELTERTCLVETCVHLTLEKLFDVMECI